MSKLTDKSLMPFGKYKGLALGSIKDEYLLYLLDQSWIGSWNDLHDYLKKNKAAIEQNVKVSQHKPK